MDEKWLLEQAAKEYFDRYESYIKVPVSDYRHIWLLFFNFENKAWDIIKTLQ
ncbi:hypothetical protein [Pelotomaculum propionicicum]|uniref:hypothetical protein n=1 Tax=Pelotomaculum propionicicum TaxID=258475 RepID=UPI0016A6C870|nr:hypothetical protein [Pelotomaculum propionicicum]NLI12331.1 hypothetical protein [Peptococcaceae bacterium]